MSVKGGQVIRMNVVCFEHESGGLPVAPCTGEFMFHDVNGRDLKTGRYELLPGQTAVLQLAVPTTTASGEPVRRVLIVPCIVPAPGGRAIPSAEVIDREVGRVVVTSLHNFAMPLVRYDIGDFAEPPPMGGLFDKAPFAAASRR